LSTLHRAQNVSVQAGGAYVRAMLRSLTATEPTKWWDTRTG